MRKILLAIGILFGTWLTGLLYFCFVIDSFNLDNSTVTNAIVVITGGRQRVETSAALLKSGYAPILFVSGTEDPKQFKNLFLEYNLIPTQIFYGNQNSVIQDPVYQIANFVITTNLKSIRLVTSIYEMPIVINQLMNIIPTNYNLIIVPHPVSFYHNEYTMLFIAYHKYLYIFLKNLL